MFYHPIDDLGIGVELPHQLLYSISVVSQIQHPTFPLHILKNPQICKVIQYHSLLTNHSFLLKEIFIPVFLEGVGEAGSIVSSNNGSPLPFLNNLLHHIWFLVDHVAPSWQLHSSRHGFIVLGVFGF